jgi:hypothetical protein
MAFPWTAAGADERPHPPATETLWNESWYFDFCAADGSVGGYVRLGLYPNLGVTWYWACLVGPGRRPVMVVDHAAPPPSPRGSLELRTDGLWADHHAEEPLHRFSLGLEAFGVALDDPAEAYRPGGMRGERTPLGFDLEWETDGEVFRYPPDLDRYEVPCRVHGQVQVGSDTLTIDGLGQRDHSWGVRDWWSIGWCWNAFRLEDGARMHSVIPEGTEFQIGYAQEPAHEPELVLEATVDEVLGPAGIPVSAELSLAGLTFAVEPLAWAPVLLTAPDGRESRFPRAMARFDADDGRSGLGWIEFNQPPQ